MAKRNFLGMAAALWAAGFALCGGQAAVERIALTPGGGSQSVYGSGAWTAPRTEADVLFFKDGRTLVCRMEDRPGGGRMRIALPSGALLEISEAELAAVRLDALPAEVTLETAAKEAETVLVTAVAANGVMVRAPGETEQRRILWKEIVRLEWPRAQARRLE